MKKLRLVTVAALMLIGLFANVAMAKDCTWTVTGTVKVASQEPELISKYGAQIPLDGIQVKVSGATIAWFDEWDTVTTNAKGGFSVTKQKSCEDRKLKIEVKFQNDDLEVRHEHATSDPFTNVKWYTIVEDGERRREAGRIEIVPTVFDAGKNHDLNDSEARSHADIWVMATKLRNHLATYGTSFKFTKKSVIKYPHNGIASDNVESSYCNPITQVVYIYKSNDGKEDHLNVQTLYHEMAHSWAFQHVSGELDLATNLIFTGSTHCANEKEHVSFHEAFATVVMERSYEEIFGKKHTLPYNRDALKEGLSCEGEVDKVDSMRDMEVHELGWMSLFRMLTTKDLYKYTYRGEASSTNPDPYDADSSNSSVFISLSSNTTSFGCSNPTNFTLKNLLDVFLPHSSKGFGDNLKKDEMNTDAFMNRAAKILGFESKETALKNLLDPTKTSEPRDELCGQLTPIEKSAISRRP